MPCARRDRCSFLTPAAGRTRYASIASSADTPERMPSHQVARLIATADPKHAATAACVSADTGMWAARYHSSTEDDQPTRTMRRIMKSTARIMKATPPYEPATWLGFSALNRG